MARLPVKKGQTNHGKKRGAKDVDQERVKQQKLYYYERQLHKAVKKAREFEVRKVSRRLKQALDSQAKDGNPTSIQTAAAQKLQNQLDAVKSLGLDDLAKQAANTLVQNGEQSSAQQSEHPPRQESQASALVRARILSAKCVQETLEVARQALARIEAAATKLPSANVQSTVDSEGAAPDSPSEPFSSDDGCRDAAHASASSGTDASEGRPEDPCRASSSSADELSEDAEELAAKRRKLLGRDGEGAKKASAQQKKQPKPPPPKKRKNRLGQRARKLLAGTPQHVSSPLKTSEEGQTMKSAGQPCGQIGKPAAKVGPMNRSRARAGSTVGIAPMKHPSANLQHDKLGQAKGGEQEQLHPSWAAKKALASQAGLLAQPQGTKVVFDDDD